MTHVPKDDISEKKGESKKWLIDTLHQIGEFTAIAHAAKLHLPKIINWLGRFSTFGAEILHHPELPVIENTVCNGGITLLKEMVDVTSAATIAVCLGSSVIATGGAMTLAVPVTAVIAVAALKAIKKISDPSVKELQNYCHKTFILLRDRKLVHNDNLENFIIDTLPNNVMTKDEKKLQELLKHLNKIVEEDWEDRRKIKEEKQEKKTDNVDARRLEPLNLANNQNSFKRTPNYQPARPATSAFSFYAHAADLPPREGTNTPRRGRVSEITLANGQTFKFPRTGEPRTADLNDWAKTSAENFDKEMNCKIQSMDEEVFKAGLKKHIENDIQALRAKNISPKALLKFLQAFQNNLEQTIKNNNVSEHISDLKYVKKLIRTESQKQVRDVVTGSFPRGQQNIDPLILDLLTDALYNTHAQVEADYAKAEAAQEQRKKEEYINNARYGVDIAANVAYLFGHSKSAQQISVMGNALINVGLVYAFAPTLPPLAIASILSGSCASIKSLFDRHKGPDINKIMMDALRVFGEQLHLIRKEMHERFDEVMDFLRDERGIIVKGFLDMKWRTDNILEQIQALRSDTHIFAERQADASATTATKLDNLRKTIECQSQVNEVKRLFTETEIAVRDHQLHKSYARYTAAIETHALASDVGARDMNIVGSHAVTSSKNLPAFLDLATDNALHNKRGYFALNTLLSYFHQLNMDYYYHNENLIFLLKEFTKARPDIACSPLLDISNLLLNDPDLGDQLGTHPISLRMSMKDFDNKGIAIQIFPIQYLGSWHLFVVDTLAEHPFHYYGRSELFLLQRLQAITEGLPNRAHYEIQNHASVFEPGLGPDVSALLMLKQCSEIAEGKPLENLSTTLNKTEAAHLDNQFMAKPGITIPQRYEVPANPLVWQYLTYALSSLVCKQYPNIDAVLSTNEIVRLQLFIQEGSTVLTHLQRLRNDKFIELIVKNYEEAASALSQALEDHRKDFEKNKSRDRASACKLELADVLFDTSALANQEIEIKTDYGSRNRNVPRYLPIRGRPVVCGWFYATWAHVTHKEGLHSSDRGWDYADGNRKQQMDAYETARKENIKNLRRAFIDEVAKKKKKEKYHCEIDLYRGIVSFTKYLPICIYPYQDSPKNPILPMVVSKSTTRLIPTIYYKMQMMGLGRVELCYKIDDEQFVLNAHFIQNENNINSIISSLAIPFEQSFFDEPESILNFWYGGKYCDDLGSVDMVTYPPEVGNTWVTHRYVYVPKCTEHTGLYQCIDQHMSNVKFLDSKKKRAFWQTKINEILTGLRKEWYTDLRRTMVHSSSLFGNAVATFEACAKMLSLVSEIVLADKKGADMFASLMHDHPHLAFNQRGLANLLKSCPEDDIAKCVAPLADTAVFLENAFTFLQTMRWNSEFPFFDGARVISDLLECMDRYVKNMTIGPSITEKAAIQEKLLRSAGKVLMQNAQYLRTLSAQTSDPEMKSSLEKKACENEEHCAIQIKIIKGIDAGAPDVRASLKTEAPNLTGYHQNGLLKSRATLAEVKELPVRDSKSAPAKMK